MTADLASAPTNGKAAHAGPPRGRGPRRAGRVLRAALLLAVAAGCATPTRPPAATIRPRVFKALWVDSWGPGLYSRGECDRLVDWAERSGFNTLLVEVRKVGDAYYRSDLEPRGRNEATGEPVGPEFDPLGYLVDEARRRRGLRVEAWIVVNRVWKGRAEPPRGWPRHVVHAHPEWLLRDRDGRVRGEGEDGSVYLDPSDPAARRYVAGIARDIVRRYDVDAVHLDYIRYPTGAWGFGERSLARFRRDTGAKGVPPPDDARFIRWRAEQVTAMVREIRQAVAREAPRVELTAAGVSWGAPGSRGHRVTRAFREVGQDWPAWCAAGLVDAVYVMHYRREHDRGQSRSYRDWLPRFAEYRSGGKAAVVIGQGAYLNAVGDSIRQLEEALEAGFDGVAVFSYRSPSSGVGDRETLGRRLREGPLAR